MFGCSIQSQGLPGPEVALRKGLSRFEFSFCLAKENEVSPNLIMTHFRTWQWSFDYEDASVSCSPDGVNWSADMAYYAGKPAQPTCHQSFAAFLAEGTPEGYESVPEVILLELQETARWAQARQKVNTGEGQKD